MNRSARISGAADGGQIWQVRCDQGVARLAWYVRRVIGCWCHGSEGEQLKKTEEELDEDAFRLLNPNVSRDVVLLRRMGFGLSQLGERRLKGLETPEMLWLVYPKQLAGRLEQAKTDDAVDAPTAQVYEPTFSFSISKMSSKSVCYACVSSIYPTRPSAWHLCRARRGRALQALDSFRETRNPMDSDTKTINGNDETSSMPVLSHQARR